MNTFGSVMKEIGKIVSVHGVDGDVVISHLITNINKVNDLPVLMIEVWKESYIPFFINQVKSVSHDDMILSFEEINSREEAKKYLNKKVYVFDEKIIQTHSEEEWAFLIGYTIQDSNKKNIGVISDIITNGMQVLIELEYNQKTVHLPLHQDLIVMLNKAQQLIILEIAEGLLEV
ncbi:MAG: 16S rRNA processing protein RimM [Bacteroidetes bacterium]|nr:16S rRNA processing protein RimM [Bacteroidota bacterium]MBK8330246.1 16S rRNA processing protein RimM [Bacteroidota bacterium]MBK9299875.1 16S rRNA processing protein RimM [Bacteroidota bacterium]